MAGRPRAASPPLRWRLMQIVFEVKQQMSPVMSAPIDLLRIINAAGHTDCSRTNMTVNRDGASTLPFMPVFSVFAEQMLKEAQKHGGSEASRFLPPLR